MDKPTTAAPQSSRRRFGPTLGGQSTGRGGQPQETSIWIKASGDTFTGYMNADRNGDVPIVDGKVNGDQITFTTVTDNYGEDRRAEYIGSITHEGLGIHPPAGGGGRGDQPRELLAKRVSSDMPPLMPEKVDLGPRKEVKYNGLAKTPPMDWNSWKRFRNQVSDKLLREVPDGMVRNGLKDAGYVVVNIDDTWVCAMPTGTSPRTNVSPT